MINKKDIWLIFYIIFVFVLIFFLSLIGSKVDAALNYVEYGVFDDTPLTVQIEQQEISPKYVKQDVINLIVKDFPYDVDYDTFMNNYSVAFIRRSATSITAYIQYVPVMVGYSGADVVKGRVPFHMVFGSYISGSGAKWFFLYHYSIDIDLDTMTTSNKKGGTVCYDAPLVYVLDTNNKIDEAFYTDVWFDYQATSIEPLKGMYKFPFGADESSLLTISEFIKYIPLEVRNPYFSPSDNGSFSGFKNYTQFSPFSFDYPILEIPGVSSGDTGDTNQEVSDKIDGINGTISSDDVGGASSSANNFFNDFTVKDNGGISGIITSPLKLINGMIDGNNQCENLSFNMSFLGKSKDVSLPSGCILWDKAPDSVVTVYQTLICGIFGYVLLINLFKDIENIKNPKESEVDTLDL